MIPIFQTLRPIHENRRKNHDIIIDCFSVTSREKRHDHAKDHAAGGAGSGAGDRGGDGGLWTASIVSGCVLCCHQHVHRNGLSEADAERNHLYRRQCHAHRRAAGSEPAGNAAPVGSGNRLRLCHCSRQAAVRRTGLQLRQSRHYRTCVPAAVFRRRYDYLGEALFLSRQKLL